MKFHSASFVVAVLFAALTLNIQPVALGQNNATSPITVIPSADTFGTGANQFTIPFVSIGLTNVPADTNGLGAVPYEYRMGTYEISQNDITMATASGMVNVAAGAWTGNQPAANISWYEAAAFVNWLNTSTGNTAAYNLTFGWSQEMNENVWSMALWPSDQAWTAGGTNLYRNKDAYYFLPSVDEWYKAAYLGIVWQEYLYPQGYYPNYFEYPTGSDAPPEPVASGTNAGTAVYDQPQSGHNAVTNPANVDIAGGLSQFGTMGQGGNVWELLESAVQDDNISPSENRENLGGSWSDDKNPLSSANADQDGTVGAPGSDPGMPPELGFPDTGFRVASVPEPSTPDAYTWDGGAGNGNWNAAANWSSSQVPPNWQTVHFAGNNQLNVDTNTNQSVSGIVFDENAGSFTISNNTINLAGNIEIDSPNDQTINCNINLVTNSVIAADAARLALGGLITFGGNSKFLAISGANSTDITGNISGNGSLLKRGAGTLTLSGANTYDGETLINAGNLILQGGAALKDSGIVKLAASGATLHIAGSETIGSLQGGGATAIHSGQTLTIAETGNATYSGAITGAGALTKTGSGKWILSGANTYTGNTTINAGNLILEGGAALHDSGIVKLAASAATLTIGASETIGSLQGGGTTAIHSGQTLTIAQTDNATYAGAITGAGALTKSGNGKWILSGANTYTGGTTLSGGTLQLLHANALGNGSLYLSSGILAVGNASNSVGLFVPGHITWASSNAIVSLASTGNITMAGHFTDGGNVGNRTFDFGSGQYLQLGNNTLVNFGATTFNATHFQATYSPGTSLSGTFQIVGNSLVYALQGGSASGSVINNSGTGGTPTWVDFTVNGSATTSTGSNTIRSLAFANNGNLAIQAGHSLTLSQGQVAVQNGTSLVSGGTLATPGNFNKTGAGELDVQSTLAVNGTASIDAGLLTVNGQLIADSVVVNPNATLGGAGLIVGNVNVNGNLSPGNSPGTLAIAGNLALTGANSTLIEIASPTNFDRIVVSGSANLGGALNVVEFGGFEFTYGQQYAFLTAGGGITGEFDSITAPETFRGRFLNLGTTGVLLIAPDTYTRVAVTPNQREVAQALDSFIPATSGDRETVSIALDLQTAEQYPYAFEQIMPGFYESLANIAIEQTYNQAQLLTQRLGTVRLGATGFQAIGLSQPIKYDKDGKSASDAKTASPIVESAIATNWNSWVIANGEFSLSRGLAGVPNYNNNAGGFLVGADYRLSENFAAGLFAGYEYSYAKYNGGSSTRGNSALFGLYGSYTQEDGYYADAIVSGGYTGFQTRRSIEFSTIDRTASADPNSGQFSAALNLGKDFEIGKFTLGPIIGAQYTYAGIGGFTESGADSLDLALGQQNANSLRTNLGARLAYNWEVGSKITLIPEVRGFWMHEFLNGPRNISSSLDGGNGASFDYKTSAPYRNSVFGGVGISAKFADRWSASVFYNVNFGAEGYTNNIISTSLGFAF